MPCGLSRYDFEKVVVKVKEQRPDVTDRLWIMKFFFKTKCFSIIHQWSGQCFITVVIRVLWPKWNLLVIHNVAIVALMEMLRNVSITGRSLFKVTCWEVFRALWVLCDLNQALKACVLLDAFWQSVLGNAVVTFLEENLGDNGCFSKELRQLNSADYGNFLKRLESVKVGL